LIDVRLDINDVISGQVRGHSVQRCHTAHCKGRTTVSLCGLQPVSVRLIDGKGNKSSEICEEKQSDGGRELIVRLHGIYRLAAKRHIGVW